MRDLSRRERQIMDIIYRRGKLDVFDVQKRMPDPPSYSTVRALLSILVDKGHLGFVRDGRRYVYSPIVSSDKARNSALKHLVDTFFESSAEQVVAALIEQTKLSAHELERMTRMIQRAKNEGR